MNFLTGNVAVVSPTLYVFVNVSGSSSVLSAVAVNVPSWLSTTVTVTVLPVEACSSFVTPATVPVSVTVYVYVSG